MLKNQILWIGIGLCLILSSPLVAWQRTYGGDNRDVGQCGQQTSDGGYVISGTTKSFGILANDGMWLLKTDSLGDTLWTHVYDTQLGAERGLCVQLTDGGYIVASNTCILKINADGEMLWTRDLEQRCLWVERVGSGYIVAGDAQGKACLSKTDGEGMPQWTQTYPEMLLANCVKVIPDGGYILTGLSPVDLTLSIVRTNSAGEEVWKKSYVAGGYYSNPGSIEPTPDGGHIVVGTRTPTPEDAGDLWLFKIDDNGEVQWNRIYGGVEQEMGSYVSLTSDGGYIIVGTTSSFGEGNSDLWLLKTNEDGDTLWTSLYGGINEDEGSHVQQTTDGGYVIVGSTDTYGTGYPDLWLIKTDSLGNVAVEEEPVVETRDWEVISSIGPQIVLQYEGRPDGFHAEVFDALGRKVDEIHSEGQSGTISWGECYGCCGSGVYFIRASSGYYSKTLKVILLY